VVLHLESWNMLRFGICNRRHELANSWCLSVPDRVWYLNRWF